MRSRLTIVAAAAALLCVAPLAPGVAEEAPPDPDAPRTGSDVVEELQEASEAEAKTAEELAAIEANRSEARETLAVLERAVERARQRLAVAEGQLALSRQAHEDALASEERAREAVTVAEGLLADAERLLHEEEVALEGQIAETYKHGGQATGLLALEVLRQAQTPNELMTGMTQLRQLMAEQSSRVGRLGRLRDERERLRDETHAARELAETRAQNAADTLAIVERLEEEARGIEREITEAKAKQEEILAALNSDAEDRERLLEEVTARKTELEAELEELRARGLTVAGIACPVPAGSFINDWGFPRSGGRTHKGTDMFAATGSLIVAPNNGTVSRVDAVDHYMPGSNRGDLGGISISVTLDTGERWYFAHLDAIAEGIVEGRRVALGELLGYVGNTGNAYSTPPHAHVGLYVDGEAHNPFPSLDAACLAG